MRLAQRIVMLHHGEKLAEGAPAEITRDRRVIDAYLGEEFNLAEA
jgi:branched-chain amino acid transport system ATP-binding protein